MIETKEPEITSTQDNTTNCSKGEKCGAYSIIVLFVVWFAAVIYVSMLEPSVYLA